MFGINYCNDHVIYDLMYAGYGVPSSDNINRLDSDEVFVFGSNIAGRHGKGAALQAMCFGAKRGIGVGHVGQTYAIPTKDETLKVLPIRDIKTYVKEFIIYAKANPNIHFLVTKIGCGLAGYGVEQIAQLFDGAKYVANIHLPLEFVQYLIKQ